MYTIFYCDALVKIKETHSLLLWIFKFLHDTMFLYCQKLLLKILILFCLLYYKNDAQHSIFFTFIEPCNAFVRHCYFLNKYLVMQRKIENNIGNSYVSVFVGIVSTHIHLVPFLTYNFFF